MNDFSPLQFIREFAALTCLQQRIFLHFVETNQPVLRAYQNAADVKAAARKIGCHTRSVQRALQACTARARLAQVVRYVNVNAREAYLAQCEIDTDPELNPANTEEEDHE